MALPHGLLLLLPVASSGGGGWYIASTVLAGVGYGISFSLVAGGGEKEAAMP
ncbi:hypothetical protein [Streptomyces cyaneofuscatus]|uniref:hypothetical protein n=1 Tax=Streptomyces cyaneofuscatus TaxID=66883 RepID=UPI0033BEC0A9